MWSPWKQRNLRKACFHKLRYSVSAVCFLVATSGMCRAFAAPRPEEAPYAQVIRTLGDASNWQDALELLADMCQLDPKVALNSATFTAAVAACGSAAQWLQVSVLLEEARRKNIESDLEMSQAALAAYAAGLAWAQAVHLFAEAKMPQLQPTVVEICARAQQVERALQLAPAKLGESKLGCGLVTAFAAAQAWEIALEYLLRVRGEGLELTADTVAEVMSSCDAGGMAKVKVVALLWLARQSGVEPNARLFRTALGACDARLWAGAVSLLADMEEAGISPVLADMDAAIQVVAAAQEEARRGRTLKEKQEISVRNVQRARIAAPAHGPRNPRLNFPPVVVESTPVAKEAEAPSLRERLRPGLADVFASERPRSNLPWSGGGPWRRWEMTVGLLEKMQALGFSPEIATFNAVLSACARAQELAQCKLLLDTVNGASLQPDTVTCDHLIGGCCRRGLWEQALLLLGRARDLSLADVSTFEEGLQACFRGRQPRLALLLLAEMDRMPAGVTTPAINTAMATCARFGLWKQAIALLSELQSRHLPPDSATYAAAAAACQSAPSTAWEYAVLLLQESQGFGLASPETYASAIACCGERWQLVISALVEMHSTRVPPAARTYSDVLGAFTALSLAQAAVELLEDPLRKELGPG
ncbi:unnamed protein product [Symbiodinium natans]|uniref:Pentatricopeptide repeat-containing protein, chloroplastic n=1 Tax=Symbiodinium natans TaxID=878477 RepID=A0A812UYQ1_9DINO|nr:unnamed protein product [Symbiodinium natans]